LELQDIALEEITPFFDSLGREKELAMINAESVMSSSFITGTKAGGDLTGITGIRITYKFIPDLFIVVKEKYQGMKFGDELMEKNLRFAEENYDFLTLSTYRKEEYQAPLHLYNKHGFKDLYRKGNHVWMYIPFNRKGRIICRLLPFILPVLPYLSSLFSGQIFLQVFNRLFRPGGNRLLL